MTDKKPDRTPAKIVKAVALRYRQEDDPGHEVLAWGRGRMADKILDLAREHGIPIKEDPDLVEVLCGLDIEREVSAEVYVVVAEILAFAYRANRIYRDLMPTMPSTG